ncbi:MAG: hypothetical protein R2940_18325 [Syntrophotaleaceae bacterium]
MERGIIDCETHRRRDNPAKREHLRCPKCQARIGMYVTRATVSEGKIRGVTCVLCGYWHQHEIAGPLAKKAVNRKA